MIVMVGSNGFSIFRISLHLYFGSSITSVNVGTLRIKFQIRTCSFYADERSGSSQQTVPFCEDRADWT